MANRTLYIIGNGFDLYHGIQSKYANFKQYLQTESPYNYDLVEKYLSPSENWNNLEESFGELDIHQIENDLSDYLVSYGSENWQDRDHQSYEIEVDSLIKGLSTGLKEYFIDWIDQLQIPSVEELKTTQLKLDKNSYYLTFNYTDTLTKLYDISNSNIKSIHGNTKDPENLILGHNLDTHSWSNLHIEYSKQIEAEVEQTGEADSYDGRYLNGLETIDSHFSKTFKNSEHIIHLHNEYFAKLSNISKIYVLGHSLSDVDYDYFHEIVLKINRNTVEWVISYYSEKELEEHKNTMSKLGINSDKVHYISNIENLNDI